MAKAAADEVLRYEPITPLTARITLEDVEYRDIQFPKDTVILACALTANRDPETYDDAEDFDITADRGRAKPLTFGAGPHFCLGANLARAELEEAFAFLAPRMKDLELAGEPVYDTPLGVHGLHELPISFRQQPRCKSRCTPSAAEGIGARMPTRSGRRLLRSPALSFMDTTRRGNYESGADYVLEYGELRFTFNERDFTERVEQAAVKLGFVDGPLGRRGARGPGEPGRERRGDRRPLRRSASTWWTAGATCTAPRTARWCTGCAGWCSAAPGWTSG